MNKPKRELNQPRGHVFDGIFEYDNDLPRWWVLLFILTIVFSIGYLAWYHSGLFPAQSLEAEYAAERARMAASNAAPNPSGDAFDATSAAKDQATIAAAKETFTSTCAPCHGAAGQGVVGPNLTDDYWLHGATPAAVETVIFAGVLEKGMPAWGDILGRDKVRQLVAFIVSIQGSNPSDAKAPQGESGHLQ